MPAGVPPGGGGGGGGPLLPPPLHAPSARANCIRRTRNISATKGLRRALGQKARRDTPKASATIEKEEVICGTRGNRVAELLAVVAIVNVTEIEFAPGVTLDDEKVQVDCDGRPEHFKATEAAKGPQLGASWRGATVTE